MEFQEVPTLTIDDRIQVELALLALEERRLTCLNSERADWYRRPDPERRRLSLETDVLTEVDG